MFENLRHACRNGDLDTLKQLLEQHVQLHDPKAKDVRSYGIDVFHLACIGGHLNVAQWLFERFGLTAEDAKSSNNLAFLYACVNGRLSVAEWLVERFALTAEDVR